MRVLVLFLCLGFVTTGQSQESPLRHSLSISIISSEYIQQAMNQHVPGQNFDWRSFSEITYRLKTGQDYYWSAGITYSNQEIDDNCHDCNDGLYGVGELRELRVASGVGKNFPLLNNVFIPFLEINLSYSSWRYIADLQGGFGGTGYFLDKTGNSRGLGPVMGFEIRPHKHLGVKVFGRFEVLWDEFRTAGSSSISGSLSRDLGAGAAVALHF